MINSLKCCLYSTNLSALPGNQCSEKTGLGKITFHWFPVTLSPSEYLACLLPTYPFLPFYWAKEHHETEEEDTESQLNYPKPWGK